MAPVAMAVKFWPMLEAAKPNAVLLVMLTLFAPLLLSVTLPVNALLAFVKVMALVPALKLEVPGTVMMPDCVIAPPAVILMLPPLLKVTVGKAIAALL